MAASHDLVDVKHYDFVIEATKLVCGHKGTKVDKPSLLLMLGRCLKAIAVTKKTMALKQRFAGCKTLLRAARIGLGLVRVMHTIQ